MEYGWSRPGWIVGDRLRVCRSKKLSLSVVEDFSYDSQEIMSRLALYDYDAAIHRFEPFLEKVFASTRL